MGRIRFATAWLGGCSGCHMSFLDLDDWLITLADRVDIVYCPLVDVKEYPTNVDVALLEGAVADEEDLHRLLTIRKHTRCVVAFGDCAVTGNVTKLRDPAGGTTPILQRAYVDLADLNQGLPHSHAIPPLLPKVLPLHAVVPVDVFVPGCPPDADRIRAVLEPLLVGQTPMLTGDQIRFG